MDTVAFEKFLVKGGRSPSAVKRCLNYVSRFEEYLQSSKGIPNLEEAAAEDLIEFINQEDRNEKSQSKVYLWAIKYYYRYAGNAEMVNIAGILREERIIRKPFSIKEFRDVNIEDCEILADQGIHTINQMLKAAASKEDRRILSSKAGIPEGRILELVKLSDLARIPGVKGIRARLYYETGFDSVEKIAAQEPEEFRARVVEYVHSSGFDGVPTLPAEAMYTIEKARDLPILVEE